MPGACDGRDERFNTLGRSELTNANGMGIEVYTYSRCSLQRAISMLTVATGRYPGLLGLLAGR